MNDVSRIREILKLDDEDFQSAADKAQKRFKLLILQLMGEAQDETDRKAIMGALCAAFTSSMLLFKPDDMEPEDVIESAAKSVLLTGMQMIEFDEETLLTLRRKK